MGKWVLFCVFWWQPRLLLRNPQARLEVFQSRHESNLLGTQCPNVTVPQGDALSVEPLKQWHDNPPATHELLAQLTDCGRSVIPPVVADLDRHFVFSFRS